MASIEFKTATVSNNNISSVSFKSNVLDAQAAVQGFNINGRPQTKSDYALDEIDVSCEVTGFSGTMVNFKGRAMWKDRGGVNDGGDVTVLVIAWVEDDNDSAAKE